MRSKRIWVFASTLILAALACNVPGGVTLDPHGLETSVAETLTSLAGVPGGGGPSVTPGGPTITTGPSATPGVTPGVTPTVHLPHLRVAFLSGGNGWLVEPPAPAVQLTTVGNVDGLYLSGDGAVLVYTRHASFSDPAEIRAVNTDGTNDRSLVSSATIGGLYPAVDYLFNELARMVFIPGTHSLLLNTRKAYEGPGVQKNDDLLLLDADTGALTTVLSPGNGGDPYPSPDGAWLGLARSNSFSVSGIDGSGMHANVGVFTPVLTYSEYAWYPALVWAADSSQYGVIIPSVEQLSPGPTGSIWIVTASSGAASLVSTLPGQFLFPTAILSPDLAHLGYAIPVAAPPDNKDLYVSHLDGSSGLHLSTNVNNAVTTFSPDGQYFSYYVGDPGTMYIGSLGGGTLPLTGNVVRLIWADPAQFVYAVGSMASWTLNLGTTGGASSMIATPAGGGSIVFDVVE